MIHLAWRNLRQSPSRFWLSVSSVGLALTLILALDAVVVGLKSQFTAYIDSAGADIWIAQQGVRNLHMVNSSLPAELVSQITGLPAVREATALLYTTQVMLMADVRQLNYVIGLPPAATMGGPAVLRAGRAVPGQGEIIIDARQARRASIALGDQLRLFGRNFKVVGLSQGLSHPVNGVVFISFEDFVRFRRSGDSVSFVLIRIDGSQQAAELAARIESEVAGVTAMSQAEFAKSERQVITDMGLEATTMMNSVSFTIGLAVLTLSLYLMTLSRRSEYGLLRAVGASKVMLFEVVLAQALLLLLIGFSLALLMTVALSLVMTVVDAGISMQLSLMSLLKTSVLSLFIALLATLIPVLQLSRVDPAGVFRRAA